MGLSACGDRTAQEPRDATESVRGLVLEVKAESLLAFESLTVRDEEGREWTFEAKGKRFAGFTPAHLRDHMLSGLSVEVAFHREGEALVVDDISD